MAMNPTEAGKYLYCVADAGEHVTLGPIGLDNNQVYTIPYRDICAIVHDCLIEPTAPGNREKLAEWVTVHHLVVDAAWNRWGSVLPSGFGTILKGQLEAGQSQHVAYWLEKDYVTLREKLQRVQEKAEYSVQLFWDPKIVANSLASANEEISTLQDLIPLQPRGLAYMYRQKLEKLLKREMECAADLRFRECYGRIREHVVDVRSEKLKKQESDLQMIMNLSCLVPKDRYPALGQELDEISRIDGLYVRFTGPWPPYSFAQ